MTDTERIASLSRKPIREIFLSGEPDRIVIGALLRNGYSFTQVEELMNSRLDVPVAETHRIIKLYRLRELR